MSLENALINIFIVLVAARVAAEAAQRIRQPAVLIEIVVGIAIGPSLIGIIHADSLLKLIGQLGAILLLFEVGMQMNLSQLSRVGGDSLRVAGIGIAVPMVLALVAMRAMGVPQSTALFLAGGITATSVGITARVFGDLRALASPEARTVLGAAVADDIGGLLILTVVVALASGRQLSLVTIAAVIGGALAFVVLATLSAIWLAPPLFKQIAKRSRTEGTLMAMGLAFALGVSLLASVSNLAPIVGAFIAGLALSGAGEKEDLQRRLVPLAHFFVPIFFLEIGIDTKLSVFADPSVIGIVGVLGAVAVLGKVVAGLGVRPGRADRLLVGVAMIPRGEVGLIFAGIGLASGTLGNRYYAVLVAVVLLTTLVTPPWVRHLIQKVRRSAVAMRSSTVEPPGGWLRISSEEVELNAEPPDILVGRIGLEAAIHCAKHRPGTWLLQWLSSAQSEQSDWDPGLRESFFRLLRDSNERSWRFLQATGLLAKFLPSLEEAAGRRKQDAFNLDPGGDLRWELLDDLHALIESPEDAQPDGWNSDTTSALVVWSRIETKDLVLLAALGRSAFNGGPDAGDAARGLAKALGLDEPSVDLVAFLVAERSLLVAASKRIDMGTEDSVLELAAHIASRQRADALYVLAVAEDAMEIWERERLDTLFELVQAALAHSDLAGAEGGDLVEVRRKEISSALSHLPAKDVEKHLRAAPRRYLVAHGPEVIARHLKMMTTPLDRYEVRLEATPAQAPDEWDVHLVVRDRRGLLASITSVFASRSISVQEAFVSTWRDGAAIDVFRVKAAADHDWEETRQLLAAELNHPSSNGLAPEGIEGTVDIDNLASPWHTIVEVRAYDRTGLLHRVASALARAGLQVHMALVNTAGEVAVDIFYVTGRNGGKLDEAGERDLRQALSGRPSRRWRMIRRDKTKTG